ncbi:large repetitive protein [Amycolatopsis sp. lyj-23]|uniref:large repetitive protein n=1 Tax=Amycolatopsis sp. lyj-23 TaxID=2789283 RepID=UPI003978832D
MPVPEGTAPLVGQYSAAAPALDPSSYATLDSIEDIVSDIVHNADGSKAGSSKSTSAQAWYDLETAMKKAEAALATVNERFTKQIKAVKDALEGEAGEAFAKYATAVLKTSEEVYDTVTKKQFDTTMGNIGRASQNFAASWWHIHDASTQVREQLTKSIGDNAQKLLTQAKTQQDVATIVSNYVTDLAAMKTSQDSALLKDLQNALGGLGTQYNARAADLVPLYISDGDTTTAAPQGSAQQQIAADQERTYNPTEVRTNNPQQDRSENTDPNRRYDRQQENADAPATPAAPGEVTPGQGAIPAERIRAENPTGAQPGLAGDTTQAVGNTQKQALDDAKKATTAAIDGLTSPSDNPQRKQALADAKQAAQGAIDGLTGSVPGALDNAPATPGAVGGVDPATKQALADAKDAAGNAIGSLAGQTTDPKRKKALEEAKQAAEDAIDGLADPAGAPEKVVGGPDKSDLERAKDAAGHAIDDLAQPSDSDARKQGLDDAKRAAADAMDGLADQPGTTDENGPAHPQDRAALLDAKHEAQKAIDDLICKTDDPERKQALEDARKAMGDAIDQVAAPDHFKHVQDAKAAADGAIDGLRAAGDDPQRQQALEAAKNAANQAIGDLNDTPELNGPGHEQALQHAKDEAAKAVDALARPDDTPAERKALADAKQAINQAIDGTGGAAGSSALHDFLKPPGKDGLVAPAGGVGGGVGAGAGLPATSAGPGPRGGASSGWGTPGSGDHPVAGKFDTQPFQGSGSATTQGSSLAPVASANSGPAGSPMGPMGPMGGMGGGHSGQGEKEREPQIWLQVEQGAWDNGDGDDERRGHVLGRS